MGALLQAKGLRKTYDQELIINVENLTVNSGQIMALMGPNGAGKTTLVRLLSLIETPDEGHVYYRGKQVEKSQRTSIRRHMAVIWQRPTLFAMSVQDNIALGLHLRRIPSKEINRQLTKFLGDYGLENLAAKWPNELSGGEIQKISVARALITQPDLLFVDEPNTYLDQDNLELVERVVQKEVKTRGMAAVIVTHDLHQATNLAQKFCLLQKGAALWEGEDSQDLMGMIHQSGERLIR